MKLSIKMFEKLQTKNADLLGIIEYPQFKLPNYSL